MRAAHATRTQRARSAHARTQHETRTRRDATRNDVCNATRNDVCDATRRVSRNPPHKRQLHEATISTEVQDKRDRKGTDPRNGERAPTQRTARGRRPKERHQAHQSQKTNRAMICSSPHRTKAMKWQAIKVTTNGDVRSMEFDSRP